MVRITGHAYPIKGTCAMNIMQPFDTFRTFPKYPSPKDVVWTAVDVIGMFVDAQQDREFGGGRIVTYRRDGEDSPIRAIVRDKRNDRFAVFEMGIQDHKPRQVAGIRVKRRNSRPRLSREFKLWLAKKRWEDR